MQTPLPKNILKLFKFRKDSQKDSTINVTKCLLTILMK